MFESQEMSSLIFSKKNKNKTKQKKQEGHHGSGSLTWAKIRSGGHFVQLSGTILVILVEGHQRNISVKLFWNRAIGLGRDVI